ncbi:YafY family protein [Mediterraneibacter gnavus]|uniref:WYL domain-containing protein n=1 Tax=Mediterraneibacter gnavus TaxID=33038 RepID=A0A2N5PWR4_MEDGN|nr:WYL domain-containing protein [Mediterraneibacter gnavus]PLT82077.1 WYL domain-containing protein [Mediterraneibacter gnavus]
MEKESKNFRILDMYVRFCEGKILHKLEEAHRFGVDERSIQRDIDDIRAFLDEQRLESKDTREIVYDRTKKGFIMIGSEPSMMTNSEILAVSKILLESRAFTKRELKSILDKLVEGCVPLKNMKLVSELISNEKYHYVELNHKEYIQDKLWDIGSDIQEHNLVSIRYARANAPRESIKRVIEPISIMFSEYYFYLNAFIVEKNDDGRFVHKYDYPAIFRIDRIKDYKHLNEKFRVSYANRFEEGEFRKRIQFMYAGKLLNIRLKYFGDNPEPILDRLPTARVVEQYEHECVIDAEVYGKGCLMWLLSQGEKIEILRPESLREEMKNTLIKMLGRYE